MPQIPPHAPCTLVQLPHDLTEFAFDDGPGFWVLEATPTSPPGPLRPGDPAMEVPEVTKELVVAEAQNKLAVRLRFPPHPEASCRFPCQRLAF